MDETEEVREAPNSSVFWPLVFMIAMICLICSGMWFFVVWLPSRCEIRYGYKYEKIVRWMEGSDAEHYWPTLKKAMADGVITRGEYNELEAIETNLDLLRGKSAFLKFYQERKDYWEKGHFGNPVYLPENTEDVL